MPDNNTNGQNGFHFLETFTATLLAPSPKRAASRRAWGIEVENVWVPYFTATNVMGKTNIPAAVLGKPLRLRRNKDGSVKFLDNGRPAMQFAPELSERTTIARVNYTATLQAYAGFVQSERPDDYRKMVELSQLEAKPIVDKEAADLSEALRIIANSHKDTPVPTPAPAPKSKAKVA